MKKQKIIPPDTERDVLIKNFEPHYEECEVEDDFEWIVGFYENGEWKSSYNLAHISEEDILKWYELPSD